MGKLLQPQQEKVKDAAKTAKAKLEEAKKDITDLPASDETNRDRRTVLKVIADKILLFEQIIVRGATFDINEDDIRRWTKELEENGAWLGRIIDALLDAIATIVETIGSILEGIGKKIVSFVQKLTGSAEVAIAADGSMMINGTANGFIEAGGILTGVNQGDVIGEFEGEFSLGLAPIGDTHVDHPSFYKVTSFKSSANLVVLAQIGNIEEITEGLDKNQISMIEVDKGGLLFGEIYTVFSSPTLKTQEYGPVMGKIIFKGQLDPTRTSLTFESESYEFFSMERLS